MSESRFIVRYSCRVRVEGLAKNECGLRKDSRGMEIFCFC